MRMRLLRLQNGVLSLIPFKFLLGYIYNRPCSHSLSIDSHADNYRFHSCSLVGGHSDRLSNEKITGSNREQWSGY